MTEKLFEFPSRIAALPFSDVANNGDRRTPDLTGQSIRFHLRK
jgi:hypothetical protein